MKDEQVYLNGRIIPAKDAAVSVFDAGLTHGAGLFETMRAYRGGLFRPRRHLERMARSAEALGMRLPFAPEQVESAIRDVLAANGLAEARVRLVVTAGAILRPGMDSDVQPDPTVLITAGPVNPYPPELYAHGMRVCICPWKQNRNDPLAGHKTIAYLPRLMALHDAARKKCQESLWFTTENRLAEGSVCNVFIVSAGVLVSPPLDTPVLPGVTRDAVIELARSAGIEVAEREIVVDTLLAASEVFLTGSVLEIMPVTAIERHVVGEGAPGPMTTQLRRSYADLLERECGA